MLDELNCRLFVCTAITSCQNKSDKEATHTVRKLPFFLKYWRNVGDYIGVCASITLNKHSYR